jgi:iron complex transport system ATP-binding protein
MDSGPGAYAPSRNDAEIEDACMTIVAQNLSIGYPGRLVGEHLSIRVNEGEVLALLGPNGGGKTTLLKTLLGLLPPRAGAVTLSGQDLRAISHRERARMIGYVPQVHTGTFAFTVETVVMMGRTAHGSLLARPSAHDLDVTRRALERFGIGGLAHRPYTEISGGERQLVLLARALAQEPRFIVLDEPTASLDFGNQGKVMREIRALAESGLGVLFTTHDPNHALRAAQRAYLLRNGECLAEGPVAEVLTGEVLEALYRAPVQRLQDSASGSAAFLPG